MFQRSLALFGRAAVILIGLAAVSLSPLRADEFSAPQKAEIESIIKSYLVNNPEILRDVAAALEAKEKLEESKAREQVLADKDNPLHNDASQAVIGNPQGAITLVEFFDYNCGYCKRALGDLARLMKDNPDLRVVLRDLPILRQESVDAAKVANAASIQLKGPKFWEFHQKLLATRATVGKGEAIGAAKDAGADLDKLARDAASPEVTASIEQSIELAKKLNITGTPSYVIGDEVVVGAVGYPDLQSKIAAVRKCGKAVCS
ncbi:DSBA oxidoreductase [Methylocella silvestris BL2]|uniref:DSBA oxidoreductase n=1 Tax=Methylocella silvestris (strain DSM 15510 / CIP 108128 / LMG 27833 / NCIMB 13906 / BL2) TaxID=395965 RepID=B8EPB3_METSB|nr:DsbA family protein [Methylocella silvestris]ACK49701.1 DSBA oxidoreductase [Methylocella silvestris BL2]